MRRVWFLALIGLLAFASSPLLAHDTWVQTNSNLVRTGDCVHIDLMLGNHGNEHRDFKLASKVALPSCKLQLLSPKGESYDLIERLTDTGYTPNEGYWTTRYTVTEPGTYTVGHTFDQVMSYAPVRAIKSAKALFVVSDKLDDVPTPQTGFDKPLGHTLELVPTKHPVLPMGPGTPIVVKLLWRGEPLAGTKVSFIPRGETLAAGTDEKFERMTDADGAASFTPTAGNYYLVVAHREEPNESGEGFKKTKYSATLTVFVPQICTCCAD